MSIIDHIFELMSSEEFHCCTMAQIRQKVKNTNELLLKIINDVDVSLSLIYHTHICSATALQVSLRELDMDISITMFFEPSLSAL